MLRQPRRHGGSAFAPLASPCRLWQAETVMVIAEVIAAAYQIHPRPQRGVLASEAAAAPDERRQSAAEGRVEPLDEGGVDHLSPPRGRHPALDLFPGAAHRPMGYPDDPATQLLLDHLPHQKTSSRHQPRPSPAAGIDRGAEVAAEG